MASRSREDLELARLISDRLALVLTEQPPRRARGPGPAPTDESAQLPTESTSAGVVDGEEQLGSELLEELPKQRFSRTHVGVIGVLLVLGLLTAGWLLLRARPVAVASPSEVVTVSTPTPIGGSAPTTSKPSSKIVVHVIGAVRHPGLVQLG